MQENRAVRLSRAWVFLWVFLLLSSLAVAAERVVVGEPFTQEAFAAAQKAGQPILVTVHADWCRTCRTQAPILQSLLREPRFAKMAVFRVDFDTQKDVLRQFRVQWQSTLIVFKGEAELERTTALVDAEAIEAQLAQAL